MWNYSGEIKSILLPVETISLYHAAFTHRPRRLCQSRFKPPLFVLHLLKIPNNCSIRIHKTFMWNNRCFPSPPTLLFVVEQHVWAVCPIHRVGCHEKLNSLLVVCKILQPWLCKKITCVVPTILTLSQIKIFFSDKCVFKESWSRGERRRQYF